MQFDGALIKEQGVTFAIVVVKPQVLTSPSKEKIRAGFKVYFGNIPIILMAQNTRGVPTYDGRTDTDAMVKFVTKIVSGMTLIHLKTKNFKYLYSR